MPKVWYKVVIAIISIILLLFLIGFSILVFSEYFPEDRETLNVEGESTKELEIDKSINIITYNLGYLSLDNTQDFFMDGGKGVRPKNATTVTKNLAAVKNFIENQDADVYLFQEVDTNSKRSYYMNEYDGLKEVFNGTASFAYMFKSLYIPYPILEPVGHVESGNVTLNKFNVKEATRIALPSAYSWPKRAVMYKNPILEERVEIKGSQKELVIYNVHLDAYGKKDGKGEQLNVLIENMKAEVEKGNYVIAGGDFNQTFPDVDLEKYPVVDTKNFVPTQLSADVLPEKWKFVTDASKPTSRLLNEVYTGNYDKTQLYVIDGYIVGPNIEVRKVETIENNFSYSDHHPVKIRIKLK